MGRPVPRLLISNQNLRVSSKPVNPQDCVWKNLYRNFMRTISQERGDNSLQHYNLAHKLIFKASSNEDTRIKGSGGQGMGKIGENFSVEPDEKSEVRKR